MSRANTGKSARSSASASALARLLESSSSVVWCASVDATKLIYMNPAGLRLFGRDKAELLGEVETWLNAIHEDDRNRFKESLAAAAEGESTKQRYRIVNADGDAYWLQDDISLTKDSKGVPLHIGGVGTDTTSDMRLQDSLLESKAVLQSLIEDLPMNVLRKDLRGRIVFANQRYRDSMNLSLKELVGKDGL